MLNHQNFGTDIMKIQLVRVAILNPLHHWRDPYSAPETKFELFFMNEAKAHKKNIPTL